MNRLNKWSIATIGGVILAGVLGAGAVMAQTPVPGTATTGTTFLSRVAQKLGIDTPTLQNAIKTTQNEDVDAQVAAGTLTQTQADQIKQRIANAPEDAPIFGGGFGEHGRGHGGPVDPQKVAAFFGITTDQFRTEMNATGATLATVAQAHGKSRDELKAYLTTELKSHVADEVTSGDLTQAQAAAKIVDRTANLDQIIDSTGPHRGGRAIRAAIPATRRRARPRRRTATPITASGCFASYGLEQAGRTSPACSFSHAHVRTHRCAALVRSYPALKGALAGQVMMDPSIHRA